MSDRSAHDIVRAFYEAVRSKDADAVAAVVDDHFAADAWMSFPQSLPYGGTVAGVEAIRSMLTGAARSRRLVGPAEVEVRRLTGDGQWVAAEVTFQWHHPSGDAVVPTSAVEWWEFADDRVVSVTAYYADTAGLA